MPRNTTFSLDPEKLPGETRPGWGLHRDNFRALRKLRKDAQGAIRLVRGDADLTEEARGRKVAAIVADTAAKANESYTGFREQSVVAIQKLEAAAWAAAESEKAAAVPASLTEKLLDELVTRLARSEVVGVVDQALASEDELAVIVAYQALLDAGDARAVELFERVAPDRVARVGGEDLADLLRQGIAETNQVRALDREKLLPDAARLLLDHVDSQKEALQVAEVAAKELAYEEALMSANEMVSLVGAEAAFGPALSGLGE